MTLQSHTMLTLFLKFLLSLRARARHVAPAAEAMLAHAPTRARQIDGEAARDARTHGRVCTAVRLGET